MREVSHDVQSAFDRYIHVRGFECLESYRGLRALDEMIADLTTYDGLKEMLLDNSDLVHLIFDYVKESSAHDSTVRANIMQYAVEDDIANESDPEDSE